MDDSPLRKISPELRNAIYELVFAGNKVELDNFNKSVATFTHVCKAIRNESRLLLFAEAKLMLPFSHTPQDTSDLYDIFGGVALDAIPQQVIAVRGSPKLFPLAFRQRTFCVCLTCPRCNPLHHQRGTPAGVAQTASLNQGDLVGVLTHASGRFCIVIVVQVGTAGYQALLSRPGLRLLFDP